MDFILFIILFLIIVVNLIWISIQFSRLPEEDREPPEATISRAFIKMFPFDEYANGALNNYYKKKED